MCGLCDCANCVIYSLCVVVYNIIFQKVRGKRAMCKQKIMQEFSGGVKLIGVIFLLRRMNEKAVNSGGGNVKK